MNRRLDKCWKATSNVDLYHVVAYSLDKNYICIGP